MRWIGRAGILLGLVLAGGCGSSGSAQQQNAGALRSGQAPSTLRVELTNFVNNSAAQVELVSAQVVAQAPQIEVRRAAVLWKMNAIPGLRAPLERADDDAAMVAIWLRCAQMQAYFGSSAAKQAFGEEVAPALSMANGFVSWCESISKRELGEERFLAAQTLVEEFVDDHPAADPSKPGGAPPDELGAVLRDTLGKPLDVVMRPLQAINPGAGLSDTAAAVERFSATVEGVNRDMEQMPAQLRWQIELLMLALDENSSAISALGSLSEVGESARRLSTTAEALLPDLKQQAVELMTELESRQGELQKTLGEVRGALSEADGTLKQAGSLVGQSEQAAGALTELAQAIEQTLKTFEAVAAQLSGPEPAPDAPPAPAGKPFDIDDYTRTAEALGAALASLDASLKQVSELSAPGNAERVTALVERSIEAAAWRLFGLGAALVLLAGAVALGVRRLAPR